MPTLSAPHTLQKYLPYLFQGKNKCLMDLMLTIKTTDATVTPSAQLKLCTQAKQNAAHRTSTGCRQRRPNMSGLSEACFRSATVWFFSLF